MPGAWRIAIVAVLALAATPAAAHLVGPDHPLYEALRHPAFELPTAATMIALGLWAGQQAARTAWAAMAAFLLAVIGGALAAGHDALPPLRGPAVALSMMTLGALSALKLRAPAWIAVAVALTAGAYQGVFGTLAHWQGGTGPYPVADLAVAAVLLPLAASQLAQRIRAGWAQIAVRVVGSWIAASGLLLLALLLRIR